MKLYDVTLCERKDRTQTDRHARARARAHTHTHSLVFRLTTGLDVHIIICASASGSR